MFVECPRNGAFFINYCPNLDFSVAAPVLELDRITLLLPKGYVYPIVKIREKPDSGL